ncbi:MdlB ABC-type multidrug transport system, ATPase and permease components [Candidatus Nanopelagicaceae bacterium]
MNLGGKLHLDLIIRSMKYLNRAERRKIVLISCAQVGLAIFDVIGVSFFGAIASLVLSSINSQPPAALVLKILEFLNLDSLTLQSQTAALALIGVLILGLKTYVSYKLSNKILMTLSISSARLSQNLISKLFLIEGNYLKGRNTQSILYDLATGVSVLTVGVLGISASLISDLALLVVIFASVFYISVSVAVFTAVMFIGILILLRKFIDHRAHQLSTEATSASVNSNVTIIEILENLSTISITGTGAFFQRKVFAQRKHLNEVLAKQTLLPNIGKSVLEVSVLFGVLVISGLEFLIYDSKHAILNLSIFLIAASRITPAVLRVQYGLLQVKSSAGTSDSAIELMNILEAYSEPTDVTDNNFEDHALVVRNLEFDYPQSDFQIRIDDIHVSQGEFIAIVGPSGGGKSTLVKMLTGLIRQKSGSISYSNQPVRKFLVENPGEIAYVPQHVGLIEDSLEKNVSFGREMTETQLVRCLEVSDLASWALGDSGDIDAQIKMSPESLSGGQRQRLGISRAIITFPSIIFLDEATSAIDGHSEQVILENLRTFNPKMTIVVVAHRLSSIREADKVLYVDNGRILASGTFEEVRDKVGAFDKQALAMGL